MKQRMLSTLCKAKNTIKENVLPSLPLMLPHILVFLVFYLIFSKSNVYPFGELSAAWCDLKQQGIPLLMNLKDVLSGDGSILYSFNNASGMNFWGVFLFFLSNPFSFLCVFFEKNDIYKLVNILMISKLCLASFTATLFFIKSNKSLNHYIASALGISYSLCAYGLMYYQNLMWLDMMYLFPLLALSMERVIANKGYGFYTAILALCVIMNFYLSFMVVIAVLLIIGIYLLVSEQNKFIKRKIAGDFFIGSFIAAMISAISWLPAFIQYSSSGRGEDLFETLKKSPWDTTHTTIFLLLLSSTIIVIGILSLLKPNRKKVGTFILFVLFSIPILIEPINKMWHTGSYMAFPGRYAFITIFTGLELVALALEDSKSTNKLPFPIPEIPKTVKYAIYSISTVLCSVTVYYLFKNIPAKMFSENKSTLAKFSSSLWGDEKQLDLTIKVASIFAIVYLVSALLYKIKAIPKHVFSVFLILVVVCEGCFAVNSYVVTAAERNVFKGYEEFLDLGDRIEDDTFYRIKTEKKYYDSNLLGALGYNSIGHYTSLTDLEYMNTSKALGYSSSWMELSTYGGTELSDAILGVKYKIIKKKVENSVYTNGTYSIVETFGALGLGVKYSDEDDIFSYDEYSRTDFQEKIFSTLFESDEKLFVRYTPNVLKNCSIENQDGKTVIKGKGEINYSLNVKGTQTVYFDAFGEFSNNLKQSINKGFTVYVNDKKIAAYPDGMYTGFMNLGTFKDESVKIKIVLSKSQMSLFSFGVSGLKHNVLENAISKKESGCLNAKDNKVWGTVNATAGEKLFVAVPFNKGFKVTVNGKQATVNKAFGDFYSIELVEGQNTIEMKFTPPGFVVGLLISILGIIACLLLHHFSKKKKENNDEENKSTPFGRISVILFILAFVMVIFLIYIFPILVKSFG